MEQVLREFISKICLVYLDDVIIFGKNFEEMIQNFKKVLSGLREVNLKVNPKKCVLFSQKVKYLKRCNLIRRDFYGSLSSYRVAGRAHILSLGSSIM